jgi:RNA recognition motif-containing protein
MGRKLFVGNLPYETVEQDLESLFAQAGEVETVTVVRDRMTGRARGFAFVEMKDEDGAQKAIADLHGHQLGGRALTVNEARPPAPRAFRDDFGGGDDRGRGGRGGRPGGGRRSEPRW